MHSQPFDQIITKQNGSTLHIKIARRPPLFSEAFFAWLSFAAETQLGRVIRELDNQARMALKIEQVHTRTAKIATKQYQIDLGDSSHNTIEVTGKQWTNGQFHDARFQRLETSDLFPVPEPTIAPLHTYLEQLYGISNDDAHKLAQWLGQAMLPDQKPKVVPVTVRYDFPAEKWCRSLYGTTFQVRGGSQRRPQNGAPKTTVPRKIFDN